MKITFTPSFKAKNQNIRKADDIQRTARNNFPFISPSYCDAFYKTRKNWTPEINEKYENVVTRADRKLSAIRVLRIVSLTIFLYLCARLSPHFRHFRPLKLYNNLQK